MRFPGGSQLELTCLLLAIPDAAGEELGEGRKEGNWSSCPDLEATIPGPSGWRVASARFARRLRALAPPSGLEAF